MADAGEASTTAERFRPGPTGEEEGRCRGGDGGASGVAGKKEDVDQQRAGDRHPLSSDREPSVSDSRNDKGKAAAAPDGMYRGYFPMPMMENWPFNPSVLGAGYDFGALGAPPLVPVLLPAPFPSYYPIPGQDQQPPAGGIFAVPVMPMFGPMGGIPQAMGGIPQAMGGIPQGGFIPMSFNMPPVPPPVPVDGQAHATTSPAARPAEAGRAAPQAEARDAAAPDGLRQRHVAAAGRPPHHGGPRPVEPQRQAQVVRRFQVGFQLDLLLILKLAVVVIVFNQDGTKDRLVLLLLLAGIVYLYQTGALAPILRWISLSAQRAMMPPHQPLPGADGAPNPERPGVPPPNPRDAPLRPEAGQDMHPGAPAPGVPVVGQGVGPPGTGGEDEQRAEQPPQHPIWWGIFKELQMIVVGFLTSLLPGFQHVE